MTRAAIILNPATADISNSARGRGEDHGHCGLVDAHVAGNHA